MAVDLGKVIPNTITTNLNDKIWLFYGEMGTRKTSVACRFPGHLLLCYDIGYKLINGAMALPLQSWSDFKSAVKQLDKPENKERFKCIIIDTVGQAYQACYQYMLTQMGVNDPGEVGYGMGWKKIRLEFESVLRSIPQKGYGLIMLAHSDEVEKEDKATKQKKTVIKIDIDKRPDLIIKSLADFVFYLNKEYIEGTDTPTVFAYTKLIDIDTKSRSRYFTPRFEFTYENLQAELQKAIEKQCEAENAKSTDKALDNPYAKQTVDFDTLKAENIALANRLMDSPLANEVVDLLTNMLKGVKLSEIEKSEPATTTMQVLNSSLLDLEEKLGI